MAEETAIQTVTRVVNTHGTTVIQALKATQTGSILPPGVLGYLLVCQPSPEGTVGTKGVGEALPIEEQFSELNAPTVVIVVRATPDAHENVAALLARYRGDDPKAGIKPEPDAKK
jgi:ABC-type molybdate transport system permease subunit